jgi:hypothetical protein
MRPHTYCLKSRIDFLKLTSCVVFLKAHIKFNNLAKLQNFLIIPFMIPGVRKGVIKIHKGTVYDIHPFPCIFIDFP